MGSFVVLYLLIAEKFVLGADSIAVKDADGKSLAYVVLFDGHYSYLLAPEEPGRYYFFTS